MLILRTRRVKTREIEISMCVREENRGVLMYSLQFTGGTCLYPLRVLVAGSVDHLFLTACESVY